MNEEPKQIQVIRVIETRLASTKETQMQWLVAEAAKEIEVWLREMQDSDDWFVPSPDDVDASEAESVVEATPTPADVAELQPIAVPDNVLAVTNAAASAGAEPTQ